MSDVLDQNEIDALVSSIAAGDVEPDEHAPVIFSRSRRDLESVEIRDYDFKRPERISKDQMRALHTLHDAFARHFGAFLSGFLRTIVEVRVGYCEQMTYSEFISGLPNPTSFNLFRAEELDGQVCFEFSPLIVYPIIDRLLGGANDDAFIPQRPMTLIEERLIRQILEKCGDAMSEAWEGVSKLHFRLGDMESNPQLVQIVPPTEVVVVVGFEVRMADRAGTMSLCIPFTVIEPLIQALSAQSWLLAGRRSGAASAHDTIIDQLGETRIEVAAVVAETTITVNELRDLEVGDLIMTGKPSEAPIILAAEGHPKFLAHIGHYKGSRAVRIIRRITWEDRV